jgi:hypothetical protein
MKFHSGGPIVYFDFRENKLKVCAVVSGYRSQITDVYEKGKATALKAVTNAGLINHRVHD